MKFTYSEFDGEGAGRFLSPDDLFPSSGLVDFILQYGQQALDALPDADEQVQQVVRELIDAGLLERDESGNLRLTPRMVRGMEHRSFLEIFRDLPRGVRDGHSSPESGRVGERSEGTKAYEFGDPLSEIDLGQTLRNAIGRTARESASAGPAAGVGVGVGGVALPLRIDERDFELFQVESTSDSALVILLDLSGSMMRYGRHVAAKRVAMGMRSLVRRRFPLDTVDFIGFSSVAERIEESRVPLVMPKPITTHQGQVRVKVALERAGETHPHFTNLHHGLRLARQTLARRGAASKQIFIITDGEPTAHLTPVDGSGGSGVSGGAVPGAHAGGSMLHLLYPPSPRTAQATLDEALRCAESGLRISTFALIEEYHGMEWVDFVDHLTRLVKGVAYYCTAGDLGATIMESYLSGKRQKKPLG